MVTPGWELADESRYGLAAKVENQFQYYRLR
jgi:hypothetical protein